VNLPIEHRPTPDSRGISARSPQRIAYFFDIGAIFSQKTQKPRLGFGRLTSIISHIDLGDTGSSVRVRLAVLQLTTKSLMLGVRDVLCEY
jgi:hypothetical protein